MTNEPELVVGLIDQALAAALLHEDVNLYQQDVEQSFKTAGLSLDEAYPFSQLVTILFEVLPKPSNGFHFANTMKFDRNQDCVCGSGKKLKKCCSELMSLPSVTSEEIFYAALNKMDEVALLRLADKHGWHKQALVVFFDVAMENGLFEAVAKLAPVIIEQAEKLKNNDDELVAMLLDALFEEGLDDQRFELMHTLTELKQAKSLRSLGYQRLAMIASQEGEEAKAREYIQQAIQADAKQPELPMCELTVLGINGSEQELKARAKYWLAFSKKRWGDDHPIVGFLEQVLIDGKALFASAQNSLDFAGEETSDAAYDHAMQLTHLFRTEEQPYVQTLEESAEGFELHLKPSLMPHKLRFMELFDQQLQTVCEAEGEGLDGDQYVRLSWNWSNLAWLSHLRQHPKLLMDFDVLETLMPFVYQAPYIPEDEGAELDDLSVFGMAVTMFQMQAHIALKATLDNLPDKIQLPADLEGNQGFWDVAFNVFMGLQESGNDEVANSLHQQILTLTSNPPEWLTEKR